MQISDEKVRSVIIVAAALALILCCLGAAALVGFLFVTGQAVNAILIAFVGFALGQLFNMVTHALGFNQGVNVQPLAPVVPASSVTTTQSEVVSLPVAAAARYAGIG